MVCDLFVTHLGSLRATPMVRARPVWHDDNRLATVRVHDIVI